MVFWNSRDKCDEHIAEKSVKNANISKVRASRYSFLTFVPPDCSQGLTQTPTQTRTSELVRLTRARRIPNQNFDSNDETDGETTMSQSGNEKIDKDISYLTTNSKN